MDLGPDSVLNLVLTQSTKTDVVSAKTLLRKAYATSTGIFDYVKHEMFERTVTDPTLKRPLIEAAKHKALSLDLIDGTQKAIQLYANARVWDHYHLTLMEFLDLPHILFDFILKQCAEENAARTKKEESELNLLTQGLKSH